MVNATYNGCLSIPTNQNETSCEDVEGGLKRVTFARTPIMSTYLLAFIVGEFDFVEGKDSNGVLVRVFTPTGKAEQGRYALDVSCTSSCSSCRVHVDKCLGTEQFL